MIDPPLVAPTGRPPHDHQVAPCVIGHAREGIIGHVGLRARAPEARGWPWHGRGEARGLRHMNPARHAHAPLELSLLTGKSHYNSPLWSDPLFPSYQPLPPSHPLTYSATSLSHSRPQPTQTGSTWHAFPSQRSNSHPPSHRSHQPLPLPPALLASVLNPSRTSHHLQLQPQPQPLRPSCHRASCARPSVRSTHPSPRLSPARPARARLQSSLRRRTVWLTRMLRLQTTSREKERGRQSCRDRVWLMVEFSLWQLSAGLTKGTRRQSHHSTVSKLRQPQTRITTTTTRTRTRITNRIS